MFVSPVYKQKVDDLRKKRIIGMDWHFYWTAREDMIEILGESEYVQFKMDMELNPLKGDVIQSAGGFRKVRYPIREKSIGSRKGARVIYLYLATKTAFHVVDAYTHEEKDDISEADKKLFRDLAGRLKNEA